MTKFVYLAVLLTVGFTTVAYAAAQQQNAPSETQATTTSATPQNHSPVKPGDRNCVRDTGSLIPAKKGQCLPVSGRSYSKQDIDNTGQRSLGPALQNLDPSVTVRGGN